ncbi:hypothetical protein [uncultured Arsenicicoccus sp.]|uniref:hypothetical protein n=1 Tax=uncultured Arsenicicoccus sp. TaxID=491339 RepID=UPI0025969763|nr:hypothetical protein [uncultured Arsenicicoccus sp.]
MITSVYVIDHITDILYRHEYSEETELRPTQGGHAMQEVSLGACCACGWRQPVEWDVLDAWDAWTQHTSSAVMLELPAPIDRLRA